jgi:predicted DsbA family dithiol-disulfide isomerase
MTRSSVDHAEPDLSLVPMKVTYYLDVFSSWCTWVEPTWAELKMRYAGVAEFEWKIALMRAGDFPVSREQCDWFYRRSGGTIIHSPQMLNSGWLEDARKGHYESANLVVEAARDFGFDGDDIRLAVAKAGLREGRKIGDLGMAVAAAVKAGGGKLDAKRLQSAAESEVVRRRVDASTKEFFAHQIDQRPAFVLIDAIRDKAVFSGLVQLAPLAATIDAMIADTTAYAAHAAHHGNPPA